VPIGAWTIERVYDLFPGLAERRPNYRNQLSGGERQMPAIDAAANNIFFASKIIEDVPLAMAPVKPAQFGFSSLDQTLWSASPKNRKWPETSSFGAVCQWRFLRSLNRAATCVSRNLKTRR
jgi:hypothetical protein